MSKEKTNLASHSATLAAHQFDDLEQQHDAATLGMWIFLATEVLLFGGCLLLNIAAYTTVMEGRRATVLLGLRLVAYVGLLLYWQGNWFGLNALAAPLSAALAVFYAVTIALAYVGNLPARQPAPATLA